MRNTALLIGLLLPALSGAAQNMVRDAEFAHGLDQWQVYGVRESFAVAAHPDDDARKALQYAVKPGTHVVHLDQIISVEPDVLYVVKVRVRNDGRRLRPALRIADMGWQTICYAEATTEGQWETLRATIVPDERGQVRFQLFGGGRTNTDPERDGVAWFAEPHFGEGDEADRQAWLSAAVSVRFDRTIQAVDPRFFGVNSLFWITNDQARLDGKIAQALKQMPCRLIRFPGGEVADNFHWETNRLDDIKAFPFADGPDKLGFDEFISWTNAIGAEAICVVNLESGFKNGDVAGAIAEAAKWVRYSNIERNYGVKLWELGNETDLLGTRYPLTAQEYADAVVRFSKAMKAVDPTIRIGALGPIDADKVAPIDELTPDAVAQVRRMKSWEVRKRRKELARRADPGPAWWPTLIRTAGKHVDFAIVHRYDSSRRTFPKALAPPLRLDEPIRVLDQFLTRELDRSVPIALTEWNVWRNAQMTAAEHAMTIAEQVGDYLTGGVDLANFWPMRFPKGKGQEQFRALLDFETKTPQPVYHVMQLLAQGTGTHVVESVTAGPHLHTFASIDPDAGVGTVFVINRLAHPQPISLSLDLGDAAASSGTALVASASGAALERCDVPLRQDAGTWHCELPPLSLTRITTTSPGNPARQ